MERWFPIATGRLLLREPRAADEADVHEYASDPEVVRFEPWGPNTPEVTRIVLNSWLKEQDQWPRDSVTLAVELVSEHRLIGTISLRLKGVTADFGYAFNRRYWGRGYATEAARAVAGAAFGRLGVHRLWAGCDVRNQGSYRVMEKLGMRREGLFRKDVMVRGEWRDSYLYSILEEEWARE